MTKQHWEQIEQLWQQALQVESPHREAFVQQRPNVAEPVRAEVLAMLQQDRHSADFLETPALEDAARQLAADKLNAPTLEMKGQRIGDYEVIGELGRGGMGAVYLARDLHLQRTVAVKVLPADFQHDPDRLKRFQREAEMLAKVSHPNVATLFDYDRASQHGPSFLVMEYVAGETLDERLKRGVLTTGEAVPVFRQIAEALAAAHAQGVIHRDLKPSNIKITPNGTVKVLDFGLAKSAAREVTWAEAPAAQVQAAGVRNGSTVPQATLTQPQMILGTPGYMSPEQVRGERQLDQRTDWWAFGCMLYEALAGRNPFRSHTAADTNAAILHKEPDWKTLPLATPSQLVKLIRHCLQKEQPHRLRTASEVLAWLENVREPSRLDVLTAQLRRAAPQLAFAGGALALLISLVVAYQWLRPRPATTLAVIAEQAASPCATGQSEAIAKVIHEKLRGVRGVQLVNPVNSERSQPFLMIDAALTQAALTAEASTVLKVAATNCTGGKSLINYSLARKDGAALANGTANDLSQLLLMVATALDLSGNAEMWQTSESDRDYYRAVALLEHYVNSESVAQAIHLLKKLEDPASPNLARIQAALGRAHYLRYNLDGNTSESKAAISYCDQAVNLSIGKTDPDVLLMCGRLTMLLGNFDKAIAGLESVLRVNPDNNAAVIDLARAYELKGDYAKAEANYLRAISLNPAYWDGYNQLGGFYFEQGNFEKAEEYWTRVVQLLDSNPYGYSNLAAAHLYQGEFDTALKYYDEALKRRPLADIYQSKGLAYLFQKDCAGALDAFTKGKDLALQDPELWGAIGDANNCGSKVSQMGERAYTQAISLIEKDDSVRGSYYTSLVAEWYARLGNKQLATKKIETVLQSEPDNYDYIISAIKVYKLTNQPEKLMAQFEKAIKNRKSLFEVEHDPLVIEIIQKEPYRTLIEQQKSRRG